MRVISGIFRSRKLKPPVGMDVRPTSDRLRETLFNVLTAGDLSRLEDTVWLDVYAGTGAVGIEALSRGARQVYFIDSARRSATLIRANLRALDVEEGFEVLEVEAEKGLRQLEAAAVVCDYCFVDPPYAMEEEYEQTLGFLSQSQLLKASSLVIVEHDKHFDLPERFGALQRVRRLEQGDAVLSFFRLG